METIRPLSSRPNLCTVIDFANARAARAVGLPMQPHAFKVNDLVACADGATGRIRGFKAHMAMVALGGSRCGITRAASISTLRKLPDSGEY